MNSNLSFRIPEDDTDTSLESSLLLICESNVCYVMASKSEVNLFPLCASNQRTLRMKWIVT